MSKRLRKGETEAVPTKDDLGNFLDSILKPCGCTITNYNEATVFARCQHPRLPDHQVCLTVVGHETSHKKQRLARTMISQFSLIAPDIRDHIAQGHRCLYYFVQEL